MQVELGIGKGQQTLAMLPPIKISAFLNTPSMVEDMLRRYQPSYFYVIIDRPDASSISILEMQALISVTVNCFGVAAYNFKVQQQMEKLPLAIFEVNKGLYHDRV